VRAPVEHAGLRAGGLEGVGHERVDGQQVERALARCTPVPQKLGEEHLARREA
jgi:hypothetical protein